ncbi:Hypothetical_protein [Hexamita inflata]|uniref:Hypothetical_protein n=1 Tax=Hexamita inflata TaxID=28002 RepID=A0AA86R9F0_9EUKA|nr:Hypothetical protein HINF_LOCUS56034 [Hexamita inflata]
MLLFIRPLQTYSNNHTQNLQVPVLEKLSSTYLNSIIITPYKNSTKSDFQIQIKKINCVEQKQPIIEQINNCNYQLNVQIKRVEYLNGCSEKNKIILKKLQKNAIYLSKQKVQ